MYRKYVKRALDFLISTITFILISPIMLLLVVLVRVKLGTPVFFKQERVGQNEKVFNMYKLRTMTNTCDKNGNLLPDEERLTKFGEKLRSLSLDELPELINIMRGDMSLVGPRPLLVRYIPYYTEKEHHRHDVKPGLTGLAQINGRNYTSWEKKFEWDLNYVESLSLITDINIIMKTIKVVFMRENIETGSFIEHNGVIYRPLDIERNSENERKE